MASNDTSDTQAAERTSWPPAWNTARTLLLARSATSEELARYQSLVVIADDYLDGILETCVPPPLREGQAVAAFLADVKSALDQATRDAIDQDDDAYLSYVTERSSWPQVWEDARNDLTDRRATSDQRGLFRHIILAAVNDLPSCLQLVEPPILGSTEDINGHLVEILTRLRAQAILRERRATPAQRMRLVESLQRAIDVDPAIMNSWIPPTPQEDQPLIAFLDEVQSSLQAYKVQYISDVWEADIAQAGTAGASTRDLMAMRIRFDAMEAYAARGGEPYKPTDDLPADADAETILPDFDVLTQDYGFEGPTNGSLPGAWRWRGTIGQGANGYAGIWLQYDSSEKPIHRVVIKDNYLPGPQWDWPQVWYDQTARVPNEAALAQLLNQCLESSNIVTCYGYVIHVAKRMFRIYLGYEPHGDLEDLIAEHVSIRDQGFQDSSGAPFPFRIPIPALWAIFEALASAACLMHEGRLPRSPRPRQWNALLHMDIKPRNIFLGSPGSYSWRGIPTAKLGDFGLIAELRKGNISRSGTEGYIAPEREAADRSALQQSLNSLETATASDVWSIGRVMHSLMNLHQDKAPWDDLMTDATGYPIYTDGVRDYYEDAAWELIDLVDSCLEPDPRRRTTVKDLWNQVQDEITRGANLKQAPLAANQVIWYKRDRYELWAS